jgi:phosphate transport system substrate-binding protein
MTKPTGLLCFLTILTLGAVQAEDLAVVVNKSNPVDNLTKAQLHKILLGQQSAWSAGKKISVILLTPGQPEREAVLESLCGMNEDEFNKHWMKADFNGDSAAPPKALGSPGAVRALVASIPGGIGFLKPADVNDSVKAVTVDGEAAGKPGYPIKTGK